MIELIVYDFDKIYILLIDYMLIDYEFIDLYLMTK